MRAVSTMISAAVLTVAVFTLSTTAASLDVEPVETTTSTAPGLQDTNTSSANATSDSTIGIQGTCGIMDRYNWGNFKYACHWDHSWLLDSSFNMFFKAYDGGVVKECGCDKGLWNYEPWGSSWTFSVADFNKVVCYSRDGRKAVSVKHEFDAYSC